MRFRTSLFLLAIVTTLSAAFFHTRTQATTVAVDYDIIYVRAPRFGDDVNSEWNDTFTPWSPDAGSELVLWHHETGEHEVIFPLQRHITASLIDTVTLGDGAVADPTISYDGREVVFAYFHDAKNENSQRKLSYGGSDIYTVNLVNGRVKRLTHQEFTPNTGNGASFTGDSSATSGSNPRIGIFNSGPAYLPHPNGVAAGSGGIIFTSTRNNFESNNHGPEHRASELFVMDANGDNVERIAAFNLGRALHPVVLTDGRVIFTSWENQGMRVDQQFPLWEIRPDGTEWMSVSGPFDKVKGHHFHTQTSDGDVVSTVYYNFNNNGFGELIKYPVVGGPTFYGVDGGGARGNIPFDPIGTELITPFTNSNDDPSPQINGQHVGKFTHPAGAPNNDLLVVWTPGPANHRNGLSPSNQPAYDGGLYLMPNSDTLNHPSELVAIFANDPAYNEQWPRAVVPYAAIYDVEQPAVLPTHQNNGADHAALPANTPFAIIGSSSVTYRETDPQDGDPFNIPYAGNYNFRWLHQGTDTKLYDDKDIFALRVVVMEPESDLSYSHGSPQYWSWGGERMRILGEIPLRREADPDDTSFMVKIPADTPFTFQALDNKGQTLFTAQTWHSMRAGEVRTSCGGCHAHSADAAANAPKFEDTLAGADSYQPVDLTQVTPLLTIDDATSDVSFEESDERFIDAEYWDEVREIFDDNCVACHTADPSAMGYTFDDVMQLNLDVDDETHWVPWTDWPATYYRLVKDGSAEFGTPPINPYGNWFVPQASRYIRPFQSTQSLLAWKIWGERLDGYSNAARPTESTPGDVSTLPTGANWYEADIDFIESGVHPSLSYADRLAITRWIDLGAPIHMDTTDPNHARGYFADDLRPVLTVQNVCAESISAVSLGVYDLSSGLAASSLSVTFDVAVGGQPTGTNFATGVAFPESGIVTVALPASVNLAAQNATMTVSIRDNAGHITTDTQTCTTTVQQPTSVGLASSQTAATIDKALVILLGILASTFMLLLARPRKTTH